MHWKSPRFGPSDQGCLSPLSCRKSMLAAVPLPPCKQILFSWHAIFLASHHLSTQNSHSWTTRTWIGRRKKWNAKSCVNLKLVHSSAGPQDVVQLSLVTPRVSSVHLFPVAILAKRTPRSTPVCWGCWEPVVWTICHSCTFERESL